MQEQPIKRKRGQPRKRPTFTKTFRVEQDVKEFLDSLENANKFLVLQLKSTKEFQDFLAKKQEQDTEKYPQLPNL